DGVLIASQLQRLLICGDCVIEQTNLRILHTQQEVILGERRLRRELCRFEIRGARLRCRFACFDRPPYAPPEIDLPVEVEREIVVVADTAASATLPAARTGGRGAGASAAARHVRIRG